MRKSSWAMGVLCVAIATVSTPAHGQAQGDAKKDAKERKEEVKGPLVLADAGVEPHEAPKPADPAKDRADRRKRAIGYARARWGALLRTSAAQAELRLHARRVARIDAMETVAKRAGKADLLPRIAKLRAKENARFEQRMQWVKDGKDGAP